MPIITKKILNSIFFQLTNKTKLCGEGKSGSTYHYLYKNQWKSVSNSSINYFFCHISCRCGMFLYLKLFCWRLLKCASMYSSLNVFKIDYKSFFINVCVHHKICLKVIKLTLFEVSHLCKGFTLLKSVLLKYSAP